MQMILPVQWEKTISYIEDMYITRLIECGPRSTLSNLLKDRSNKLIPYSTDKSQLDFLRDTQDKQFYVKDLVKECECAVSCCKNKAEDYNVITCKEYYEKLINMKLKSNLIYHDEDVIEAFNYIEKILCCKGYNSDEISQIERTIEKKLGFVVDL